MKKVCSLLTLVLVLSLTFISCSRSKLAIAVKAMDLQCPQDCGEAKITSVELDGNDVVFKMTLEENEFDVSLLNNSIFGSIMKIGILESLTQTEEGKELVNLLIEAEANMVYEIKGESSGDVCRLVINTEELKADNMGKAKDLFEGIENEDFEEELDQLSKDYEEEMEQLSKELENTKKEEFEKWFNEI